MGRKLFKGGNPMGNISKKNFLPGNPGRVREVLKKLEGEPVAGILKQHVSPETGLPIEQEPTMKDNPLHVKGTEIHDIFLKKGLKENDL